VAPRTVGRGRVGDRRRRQVGWIGAQLTIMQKYNFLQPVLLGFGLVVLLLALWARRHEPLVHR
jgi:hypothetical protein